MDPSDSTPPAAGLTEDRDVISISEGHLNFYTPAARARLSGSRPFPAEHDALPWSPPSENDELPVAHEKPIGRHLFVGCHVMPPQPHEISRGPAWNAGCYCDKPINYRSEREVMNDQHNYTWGHSTGLEREPLPGYISGETNLDEIKSQEPAEQNTMGLGAGGTLHEVKVDPPPSLDEIIDRHALTDARVEQYNNQFIPNPDAKADYGWLTREEIEAKARVEHDVETGFADYYPPDGPSTVEVDPTFDLMQKTFYVATEILREVKGNGNCARPSVSVRVTKHVAYPCEHIRLHIKNYKFSLLHTALSAGDRIELHCPTCFASYWFDTEV